MPKHSTPPVIHRNAHGGLSPDVISRTIDVNHMALGSNGGRFEPVLRRPKACHRAPRVTSFAEIGWCLFFCLGIDPPDGLGYVTGVAPVKKDAMDTHGNDVKQWRN